MIVDITAVSRDLAVRSIAQLEGELFGRGAWNANMVREELDAPARTYLLDVLGEAEQAVVRGYAGFWYDGEDAELMTIGVGKAYQAARHRRCVASGTGRRGETSGRLAHAARSACG